MTKQESFKRRIRDRMAETGERYQEARRVLIQKAAPRDRQGRRPWAAEPEHDDASVREATGRGWDDWCDLIDAWPGHEDGHTAVAAWLVEEHDIPGWWAQSVTVGWERITGRRLPHQVADGTFTAGKSRTLPIDHELLRAMLLDEGGRHALFPGFDPVLRSRPTSKSIRVGLGDGVVLFTLEARDAGRVTVHVTHEKLTSSEDVEAWKVYWDEWLTVLEETV